MAALLCNNNGNADGVYASFYRGRKVACRSKPPKGIIRVKKPLLELILSPIPNNERKRECESSESNDESLKKTKKRKVSTARDVISDCGSVDEFQTLETINAGSYGIVYKVRDKATGEILAMKEEMEGLTPAALTEIDILKSLEPHPNIVAFKKVAADDCDGVYVVMEYMETDLKKYIALKKEEGMAIDEVKALMKQLLEGVKFLHQNSVMHRDLKPANVLVNGGGVLKICDFGQSVRFEKEAAGSYSSRVGTLWYKAPELLRGVEKYSKEVDMWSVGCIMAELVLNKVLFEGQDEDDQLEEIYYIRGRPYDFNDMCSSSISSANKLLSEAGFDLLRGLLSYDQKKRTTAEAALNHAWFNED